MDSCCEEKEDVYCEISKKNCGGKLQVKNQKIRVRTLPLAVFVRRGIDSFPELFKTLRINVDSAVTEEKISKLKETKNGGLPASRCRISRGSQGSDREVTEAGWVYQECRARLLNRINGPHYVTPSLRGRILLTQ